MMAPTNKPREVFDLYQRVKAQIEPVLKKNNGIDIWESIEKEVDIQLKKPRRKCNDEYEIFEQRNKKNEISYIVKGITNNYYISLNQEEFFVWGLLDGKSTIKDICNIFFNKYKKLSNVPLKIIQILEEKNMLDEGYWNIYDIVHRTQKSRLKKTLGKIYSFFLSSKLSLKNIDAVVTFLYNKFAWLLLRREAVFIYCILIAAGLSVFFTMGYFEQKFSVKKFITSELSIGIILLFAILPIVLHELAHAFACKKYGRKVNRAGLMLYIGIPVLFVETTDVWMTPKKQRFLVSLAGPFTDLLIGSVCFLLHNISGNVGILQILPLVGLVAYIRCLYNFNPLLEFDGYYILMDLLEIPELRKKSFNFIRKGGISRQSRTGALLFYFFLIGFC